MDLFTLLLSLILGFLIYYVVERFTRDRITTLVDKVPGPLKLPFFGTTYILLFIPRWAIYRMIVPFFKRYGPIARTWLGGLPVVHLVTPENVETILSSSVQITKSNAYDAIRPWLGDGLLTSSGAKWQRHRKLITPTFHFKILDNFMDVFVEKSHLLVGQLKDKADGKVFDLYPYITRCTLDIICETAMGVQVNAMFNPENEYVRSIYGISRLSFTRMITPWLHPDFIFYNTGPGKRYNKYLATLHNFTTNVIQDRRKLITAKSKQEKVSIPEEDTFGVKKRKAFLDLFIEMSQEQNGFTDLEIREQVDTFMFEGHDTTTAAINWTLFLLGIHQNIQDQVYEELQGVFNGKDDDLTTNDLGQLKLLERCCKEALRLYPSVPVMARLLTEDVQLGEYLIPAGCTVNIPLIYHHRNSKTFPNPNKFDPDRFLPEITKERHPYAYVPFSAGPRNCIGQKFAMYEEKTLLAYILREYKVTSIDTQKTIKPVLELVLRPKDGLKIKLEPRNKK